ncbi:hypothetical protein [Microbacterium sp.]|uniref:hypothetical protein n=1 Tax=Microbacterium sp. TaxID=51671 RepID=UPI0039E5B9AB
MKSLVVRFLSLYAFNIVVLLVIGVLTPAHVGWHAIWASVVMTLAELLVKPLALTAFTRNAAKSAEQRTKAGEVLVQGGIVLVVAAIVWALTLILSGATAGGWFWGWVLPPVFIAIGWFVYSQIVDKVEARAGAIYDQAEAGITGKNATGAEAPADVREELRDGLTAEQRKMLDDLGT